MQEIVNKLHENRQIQLAKEILESNGYKVEKKVHIDIKKVDNILEEYSELMEKLR